MINDFKLPKHDFKNSLEPISLKLGTLTYAKT